LSYPYPWQLPSPASYSLEPVAPIAMVTSPRIPPPPAAAAPLATPPPSPAPAAPQRRPTTRQPPILQPAPAVRARPATLGRPVQTCRDQPAEEPVKPTSRRHAVRQVSR